MALIVDDMLYKRAYSMHAALYQDMDQLPFLGEQADIELAFTSFLAQLRNRQAAKTRVGKALRERELRLADEQRGLGLACRLYR